MTSENNQTLSEVSIPLPRFPLELAKQAIDLAIVAAEAGITHEAQILALQEELTNTQSALAAANQNAALAAERETEAKNEADKQIKLTEIAANLDPLTGIPNRGGWNRFTADLDNNQRTDAHNFTLVTLDLDYFKLVNDSEGHAKGDELLIKFAQALMNRARKGDFLARLGGEEFVWILQGTSAEDALKVVQGLHEQVSKTLFQTFCSGIVQHRKGQDITETLRVADRRLYDAKHNGRSLSLIGYVE